MTTQTNAPVAAPIVSAITLAFGAAMTSSQLNFAVSIAFETLPAVLDAKAKFKMSEFSRQVESASGFTLSAKTVANIGSVATHLQNKYGTKIAEYSEGHSEASVLAFADFLRDELSRTTYTLTLDDIAAHCKAEPSRADKRIKEAEAKREAAEILAKVESERELKKATEIVDAAVAAAEKGKADAEAVAKTEAEKTKKAEAEAAAAKAAKQQADKLAESLAEANRVQAEAAAAEKIKAEALAAEAEAARKVAESFALQVGVNADGSPNIVVALNPSPAFLESVAKELQKMAKAIRTQQKLAIAA